MIEKNKTYLLKQEFFKELNISESQYLRRKEELLSWIANFFVYDITVDEKPIKITIKEIIGEYQPLPRKKYSSEIRQQQTKQKQEDYKNFTLASLGTEWKTNSKRRVAREAILSFGEEKYGHTNAAGVANHYVGPYMDKYGEKTKESYWVWYDTYELLDEQTLEDWKIILKNSNISEPEAANAFYREQQGEDISKEINYYKKALEIFKNKYHMGIPIKVYKWKIAATN